MLKNKLLTKNEDILFSVLEFLDRNGFKQSFEKLQKKTGKHYCDNNKKIVEDLLNLKKLDELILFIENSTNIENEEKIAIIKILKIKKYIDLILKNCFDRIDQIDSLNYLRTEISPMINCNEIKNRNLLNSLTNILFYKDINLLKEYIKKNLNMYSDNSYIINQLCKNRIISIEELYDIYNNSTNKKDVSFKKFKATTIRDLCFNPFKTSEIWFLEISKSKNYIALGFSNCNISVISVSNDKNENNIYLNLFLTFSANENNKKGEITSLCFSNDEKHLLVSLSTNLIRIFNVSNGEKIKEYDNLYNSRITSCIYMPNSYGKFLSGGIDKRLLMIDINNNPFLEIGKFCRIKQLLYSEMFNLIILIPGSINDIICYEFPKNKISFKIEIKEEIVYTNISKIDKGKYILINISKLEPKILLYNLEKTKIEDNYYGHTQKTMIIKCGFTGDKEQYIISGSEDGKVYLWERKSPGSPCDIFEDYFGIVNCAELLYNDILISVNDDKTMRIWTALNEEDENNRQIIFNKNDKNTFTIKENNFEKEFLEKMNEPMEEIPDEDDNAEESDEEEERAGELRFREERE